MTPSPQLPRHVLLPRASPSSEAVSARAVDALLEELTEKSVECHSLMLVRHGHVVAEGWWKPYSPDRPHLLYSMTKSFTSMAVGLAIDDGVLSLDDRVADVLPEHLPSDLSAQARRLTVHHLLSMTAGHAADSLEQAWQLEPDDLVKGFLRVPFTSTEGTIHTYDNATTFVLARMVERATGRGLPEYLDDRLFVPMGIEEAEWDRVASGLVFGFHGLHLTTEAVAAFGELLLRGGRWGDQQLIPREWVDLATRSHVESRHYAEGAEGIDFQTGYGYQFWMSRQGFHGNGAFGQHCVVVPSHDLVVVVTAAQREVRQAQDVLDAIWECLLPGIGQVDGAAADGPLTERLRGLSLPQVRGGWEPRHRVSATLDASVPNAALPDGTSLEITPVDEGWIARFGGFVEIGIGHDSWADSSPLGRPIRAQGAWTNDRFVADIYVIASPHRVRLTVDTRAGTGTATWVTVPLTSPDLFLHLRSPLMTRPDVA